LVEANAEPFSQQLIPPPLSFARHRQAARLVQARGVDQRILSDANEYYIRAILDAKGLADGVFSSVITNRGAFDGPDGRLTINPFHPLDASSHGCPHCPSNLCKGAILRQWMAEVSPSKVLYVGDGANDFCPALLLEHPGSVVLARGAPHDRLLEKCTKSIADGTLKGTVVEWSEADNGAALLQTITNFLNSS
jgi:pyridoxal phosphate phosphatase PHOSPHO2